MPPAGGRGAVAVLAVAWRRTAAAQILTPMKSFASEADTSVRRWFALQVWTRKESAVASELQAKGFECFLPMFTSIRQWSDRVKQVELPLFPGYLFCRFELNNRRPLIVTPGVLQIVGVGKSPTPLDDAEISALQLAAASELPRQPWPYLSAGTRVKVVHGNLSGIEGILINFKGNHRVVLSVGLLQRSVALEVDLSWVIPLEEVRVGHSNKAPARTATAAPALDVNC
jgi:transcription antitermination factor NusG